MTQHWNEIWNRRTATGDLDLESLIKLDGFDTGAGRIEVGDWRTYATFIAQKLGIQDGATVYEVGCGAGAFLYTLCEKFSLTVGGLDYARGLLGIAAHVMPYGDFKVLEARNTEITPQYDYVIANGVFHYFDVEYAAEVLDRMIKKARIAVAVLEVPDMRTKDESEAVRRDILSPGEYEKKYAGLQHTYYARDWFDAQAKARELECELFDGCVSNYAQNRFRFGCIIRKNH